MHSKNEKSDINKAGSERFSLPSAQSMKEMGWQGLNFSVVAGVTCAGIVFVQSPVKTVLVNLTKGNPIIPVAQGGVLSAAKNLYAGTAASLGGSVTRTTYSTLSKPVVEASKTMDAFAKSSEENILKSREIATDESIMKENVRMSNLYRILTLAGLSSGEILITNRSETKTTLIKAGISNVQWNTMHNSMKLVTSGLAPRFATGFISLAFMCDVQTEMASKLALENKKLNEFASGALSGMAVGFINYPISLFKDHMQLKTIVVDGKLVNPYSAIVAKDVYRGFKVDPVKSMKDFGTMALKQVPIRMGLTGAIFSIVAGTASILGKEPLSHVVPKEYQPPERGASVAKHGLFGQSFDSHKTASAEPVPSNVDTKGPTK